MTYIETVDPSDAEGRLGELYGQAIARAGKVFNIVRMMSPNPPVLEASIDFYKAKGLWDGKLDARQAELVRRSKG